MSAKKGGRKVTDESATILKVLLWGLGACVTGFLFLAGWIWTVMQKVNERVTYEWIEEQLQNKLDKKMNDIDEKLGVIRDALVGDFQHEGVIRKVVRIEKRCDHFHPEQKHE